MPDFDAAFDALEQLDDKGRRAVELSAAMYEELYLDADARAHRAEWLIELLQGWASQRGLFFNLNDASGHWDARHPRRKAALTSRYHARLVDRANEVVKLERQLDELLEARERLEIRAEKAEARLSEAMRERIGKALDAKHRALRLARWQRDRAVAAEQRVDEMRAEIDGLRAHLGS